MPIYQTPRNGVSLSVAAAEAAAIARVTRVMLYTYELSHSSLDEPIRVVNDHQSLTAYLESGSPNTPVEFMAASVRVTRPEESDTASTPQITLTVDNVSGQVSDAIRAANGSLDMWTITERIYASDDLTAPAVMPPLSLIASSIAMTGVQCQIACSFGDPANVAVPAITFKREDYPGLSAR